MGHRARNCASTGQRDSPRWRLTESAAFSVGSAYRMFFLANAGFACAKPIWKSKATPRCKFFMWLVVHKRCQTTDNLQSRGWPNDPCCQLCHSKLEDCTHLFVHCRYTQLVWTRIKQWSGANFTIPSESYTSTEDWWISARQQIPKTRRRVFDTITTLIHWRIWKERNARVFDQQASSVDKVFDAFREDLAT